MKNFYKKLKPIAEAGNSLAEHKTWHGKLYVAYLNKALIDAGPAGYDDEGDDYDSDLPDYLSHAVKASGIIHYNSDGLPLILSPDDEMMLYGEGSSEYY